MIRAIVGMAILLSSTALVRAQDACTRPMLQSRLTATLQRKQQAMCLRCPLPPQLKYIENMKNTTKEKGLWNKALPVSFNRSFLDVARCKTFTEVIVTEGGHPYVLGTCLAVKDGNIS